MFCGDLHFHQTLYSSNISSMQANNSLISLRPCACMRCGTSIRSNSNNTSSCIGRWGFPVAVLAWQRVFTITFHSQRGKATIFSKEMGFHYHHLMQKATSNDIFFHPYHRHQWQTNHHHQWSAMDALETALSRWAARQVGAPGRVELGTIEHRI